MRAGGELTSHRQFLGVSTLRIQLDSYLEGTGGALQSASSPEVGELSELGVKVSCSMESWLFDGVLKPSTLAFSTLEAGDFSGLEAEDVMAFNLGPRSAGDRR